MTNTNTSKKITKFQDLNEDETYTVVGFRPIESKFGKSYILSVMKNGEKIELFSTKTINDYFKTKKLEEHPTKFDFTVRRIMNGKFVDKLYAEIDGNGFIELV